MLKNLQKQNITIVVSTPYMDEASLCDRIALIQNGEFLTIDSPQGIIAGYPNTLLAVESADMHQLLHDLRQNKLTKNCFAFGNEHHVAINKNNTTLSLDELIKETDNYLQEKGHKQLTIKAINPTVEDCFMLLSQK
jgi:ABC-2 type transport system ATP-binding protein